MKYYLGTCQCGCPVYRNEDGELVFTCTESPCELERAGEEEIDEPE